MAPPRKALAYARMTGATAKNPQRYRDRNEPTGTGPIGPPPTWLSGGAREAWLEFQSELPWLNSSHRAHLVITSILRAKLAEGTAGVPALQLLRQCLGQLCATPVTAGKIQIPSVDDGHDDLLD